jgi:RNA polymerase sigma factor (sigma-70 family)
MNINNFNTQICDFRVQLMQSALQFTRNNHDDADDLVQDTLIKAIRYEEKFEQGSNLQGWLFTIMRNTFINNYRSLGRRTAVLINNVDPWLYPVTESTSSNNGEGKLIAEDINKALVNLQPEYALPFLRYFEGFKYQEIADEMNIPIGTVKTRIHVARKVLKDKLKMYARN